MNHDNSGDSMTSTECAQLVAGIALEKKAQNISILDLRNLTSVTDYFVICSAGSDTHVKAVADAVIEGMAEQDVRVWKKEGFQNLQWVLLDFVDVVVHVFQQRVREFYDLERLWGDAEISWIAESRTHPSLLRQDRTST